MKRKALDILLKWQLSTARKPLILQGARQVGKSYLVKTLLAPNFKSFAEINLEKQGALRSLFEGNIDPKQLLPKLEVFANTKIVPGETLLFIDEIQTVPRALLALRYLYEELPQLHVIAAGSLLQFAIDKVGVPVGRVTFKHIAPLTFEEFLLNSGNELFQKMLDEHDLVTPLGTALHERGLTLLSEYLAVGGMPEVVATLVEKRDYLACEKIQAEILEGFEHDFPKYALKDSNLQHVALVFKRAPHLAMQHLKFVDISRDLQAKYIRAAIDVLQKAGVLSLVHSARSIQAAASFDPERYKISFLDVGLMQRATGLTISEWIRDKYNLLKQGPITEQFVAQEISARGELAAGELFYWERNARGSSAEVDFLIPLRNGTIPVEVKSGTTGTLKSLHILLDASPEVPYAVKTSSQDFSVAGKIRSIPLYAFPTWLKQAELGRG